MKHRRPAPPPRPSAPLLLAASLAASLAIVPVRAADALEPVVVTATRTPVAALDYAGSATRLAAPELALVGATHSSEALNRAAGSFLQRGSGQEVLVALRSPVLTGAGACGAFLVLEDDVPIRPVGFCNVNQLFEVNFEQAGAIEVLRGPGVGVLGANAIHGVVNVLSARAARLPAFGVGLATGSDAYRQVRLATAGRFGDETAAGLVAHYTRDGGWRDASGFTEAKLNASVDGRTSAGGAWRVALAATRLDQETAGFVGGFDAYRDERLRRSNANPEAYRDAWSARAIAEYRAADSTPGRFAARAYARTSRMDFLQHFLLGQPLEKNGQDSGGVLLGWSGTAGPLDWRAGLDLELARGRLVEDQARPTTGGSPVANAIRPVGLHYDYVVDARLAAPWAQVDWRPADRWTLTAAVRGEYVRYDHDNRMLAGNTAADGTPCPFGGCLYSRPADRDDAFRNLAPRLGATWRFAPGHSLYASAARGFRPPEATELYRLQRQQRVATLGSERIDALEAGLRGGTGSFDYAIAAYAMEKRNVILRDGAGFNVDEGRTRHRGIELEAAWSPLPVLTLGAGGTYARHTYRVDRAVDGGETIANGNDVDTAPRRLATLRAQWRPTDATTVELERVAVGPYFADAANRHRYPGHVLLNLRAGLALGGGWTARARVLNLADRAYADRADFAFGNWRYFPGRERAWFLELEYARPAAAGASR
ncbi:MAG: TonB-dependent receptor [Pseudomonadota bacterium]